ncbi:MAG: hypothetical protein ACYTEU_07295 [Planctomycetota bacterium]
MFKGRSTIPRKAGICCLFCLLAVGMSYPADLNPDTCTLQYRIIGKSTSSASQYLTAMEQRPNDIKDMPRGIGKTAAYFSVRLGDEDFNILLDAREDSKEVYALYIDSDNDLSFSDEKPYFARSIKPGWFGRNDKYRFGPVRVPLGTDSDKLNVAFHITTINGERLSVFPCRYRRGNIQLGEQSFIVSIIDGNLDGRYEISQFTDRAIPVGMDSIRICDVSAVKGLQNNLFPLTKVTRIGNDFYSISLTPDGGTLGFTPVDLKYGTLEILGSGHETSIHLWSNIAAQTISGNGPWKIPEGQYITLAFTLYKKDNKGNIWSLEGLRQRTASATFEIQPNQTTQLPMGGPLSVQTYATKIKKKNDEYLIGFRYCGKHGESYSSTLNKNGRRNNAPVIRILDERGKVLASGQLKYG